MRLQLPPTTIGWQRHGKKPSITADGLIETTFGLKVLLWDGYRYVPMDELGFHSYDHVLNFEMLVDPRDRFRCPERYEKNWNRYFSLFK